MVSVTAPGFPAGPAGGGMTAIDGVSVLVVEDDAAVRRGVCDLLRASGHRPHECARGDAAGEAAARCEAGLVLLDVALPGCDGFAAMQALRAARPGVPVIMLTARGDEDDRVRGLSLGADDYVVKPFSARELMARVDAVLRRAAERPAATTVMSLDGTSVDLARREVRRADGGTRVLTEPEVRVLLHLAARRDRAVDRHELLRLLWGCDPSDVRTRSVDMQILRLREKIEESPSEPRFVVTVRGKGYALGREVTS
jgi:DNA-binding response OmpR family regulator